MSVRRYLGANWLSVREVGNRLGWTDEQVQAAVDQGRFVVRWFSVPRGGHRAMGHSVPYCLASQVGELELRFRALEAMEL